MITPSQHLDHIAAESARFGACLAGAEPTARVPSCPDWDAADLLWHLAEVQLFWGAIVRERLSDPSAAEALKPPRPERYPELLALFDSAAADLVETLRATPPDTEVWTWAENDHTAGFVLRRQAHEALIHRIDAELVAGERTPLDAELASDGVDEALRIMYGDPPSWASTSPGAGVVRVECADTGAVWTASLARWSGHSPNTGKSYTDEGFLQVAGSASSDADAVVCAGASNLDGWLWNRSPADVVTVTGDRAVFDAFAAVIGAGVA